MTALFLRPDTDAANSGWSDQGGGTTNLYQAVDETSAGDSDYVQSSANPASDTVRFRISDPSTGVDGPFNVRYRYGSSGSGSVKITARLKQGTTVIKEWAHTDASNIWQTVTQTLTSGELATITDFTDLFVEFVASPVVAPIVVTFRGWYHQEDGAVSQTQVVNLGTGTSDTLVVVGACARVSGENPDITLAGGSPMAKDTLYASGEYPVMIQSKNYTAGGNTTIFVNWTTQNGQPRDMYVWTITGLASLVKKASTANVHASMSCAAFAANAGDIVIAITENQNTANVSFSPSDQAPTNEYHEPGGPAYGITTGADWVIGADDSSFVVALTGANANNSVVAASYR